MTARQVTSLFSSMPSIFLSMDIPEHLPLKRGDATRRILWGLWTSCRCTLAGCAGEVETPGAARSQWCLASGHHAHFLLHPCHLPWAEHSVAGQVRQEGAG